MQIMMQTIHMQLIQGGDMSAGVSDGYYLCGHVPGHVKTIITQYFLTHGLCNHQGYHCRTPTGGHQDVSTKDNHVRVIGRNIPNT